MLRITEMRLRQMWVRRQGRNIRYHEFCIEIDTKCGWLHIGKWSGGAGYRSHMLDSPEAKPRGLAMKSPLDCFPEKSNII
jgi:hypothetical protein